uniref:Group 3 allergen SMIPP-S Yv6023A04 n=1 Tax=Sarcoptes scabiei TaxID=52283 RepID=UPI0001A48AD3|nr:Chain A, Group 3 allergen SMIPP-S Yv6023A04 [Sarcoptes scabiei]3H7O_B Chain B, Group 3 allergen SMIPP-S Yv6023A04 [Sarcoptes scabiei]
KGGEKTDIKQVPWTVAVRTYPGEESLTCGGAILSQWFVLTAAHCVFDQKPETIVIQYESTNLWEDPGKSDPYVSHVYLSFYRQETMENDIAILELSRPLKLDGLKSKPAKLPDIEFRPKTGSDVLVSGYGDGQTMDPKDHDLKSAQLTVVDLDECRTKYGPIFLSLQVFCAQKVGVSLESGDAGDPTVQQDTLVGVAAYFPKRPEGAPEVFTKVGSYVSWIQDIIKKK